MHRRIYQFQFVDEHTLPRVRLALAWVSGLALGFLAACTCTDVLGRYMLQASATPVVFWRALAVNVFPLFIFASVAFFCRPVVYALTLVRGLCLGLGMGTIARCYLSAGWMICGLLMFSGISYSPVLLWYFDRRLTQGNRIILTDTWICFAIGILISVADFGIISPFLCDVINF